jgi:chemotaxis protein histidine kinase CheA
MGTGAFQVFSREATAYLERVHALLARSGRIAPSAELLIADVRALRGSATIARQRVIAAVAAALERLVVAVRDGVLDWDENVQRVVTDTLREIQALVGAVESWTSAEDQRAHAAIDALGRALVGSVDSPGAYSANSLAETATFQIPPAAGSTMPTTAIATAVATGASAPAGLKTPPSAPARLGEPAAEPAQGNALHSLLATGIAGLEQLDEQPLSAPIELDEDIVPIEDLVFRGRAALDRAREIREAARRRGGALTVLETEELFALLDLAVTD